MNRPLKHASTASVLIFVTMAAAGCGGSSSSSSSASSADFVAQANRICSTVNDQIAVLPKIITSADLLVTGTKEVRLTSDAITKLKTLTPSADQKTAVGTWIATLDRQGVLSTKLLAALKAGDAKQLTQLAAQGKTSNAQGNAQATHLGLPACAKDVEAGSAKSG